ncbi:collagen-binding domain-containing protein [Roseivirga echinicomitans]
MNSAGKASLNLAALDLNDCFTSSPYTPSAAVGDGHAMWLSNNPFPSSTTDFVFSSGAVFLENADGTATLKGVLTNTGNPMDQWEVNLFLSEGSNWTQWSSLGRTYKDEKGLVGNNYTGWTYYIENPNQTSNIVGLNGNSGKTVEITHMPANHNFGFQVGTAANNKNAGFGLSGWFNYALDGQNFHQGDFNLDLTQVERVINYTTSQTLFDCSNLGVNTITVTSTDQFGDTCTQQVDVEIKDITPPVVVTKNVLLNLSNGLASISPNDVLELNCGTGGISSLYGPNPLNIDGEFISVVAPNQGDEGLFFAKPCTTDNCSIASTVLSKSTFTCSDIGENIITITVTDQSGNVTTANASVFIRDNTIPVARAKNITVALDENGIATITPQMINNGSSDPCGEMSFSLNRTTFDCSNIGNNQVTLIVTDNSGNTKTATAYVNVIDNMAPVVVTKNITLNLDQYGQASIADALDLLVLCDDAVVDIDTGGGGGGGWEPGAGETGFSIPAPYYEAICTKDNCSITNVTVDISDFDCSNIGQNIVTVTVSDASGNETSKTAIVTIIDNTPPTVITKNIAVNLGANGSVSITPEQIDNGSSDTCGVTLSLDKTTFSCSEIGTHTVTLTATDPNGNSTSKTAIVTVADNTAPTVITQDITVALDANGNVNITADQIDNGSFDNCGITLSIDKTSFDCVLVGPQTVTLTGIDPSGNTASATATVTIVDNIGPSIVTQNITVALDANGNASINSSQVDNGTTDNCGVATIELSKVNFDCSNLGDNTVTVTATDAHGNISTKSVVITIIDNIAPTVIAQDITVTLDANGNASITAAQINNGSFDNCDITLSVDKLTFDCSDAGIQTVTLTGTDASGNTATATATVTVVDSTAPVVIAQDITVALDANGNANITTTQVDNGSFDNCNLTLSLDKFSFNCNDLGTQTITLTGTDPSGNTATATAIVTVIDNTPPVITVNNSMTVELDESGNATITQNQVVTSVGNDNCGNVTITISKTSFDCTDLGTNSITVTATDASGNVTTETVTINVVDGTAPVFTNPTSGAVISQNPTAPAMGFNVFVRNNVSFKNNETEGAVALGGDLSIDGSYQVSTNSIGSFKVNNVPVTLVVGGKVNYNSGNSLQVNQNGYVKIGNANGSKVWYKDQNGANSPIRITKDNNYNSSPRLHLQANAQQLGVSATSNPVFESGLIDFNAAFAQFEASALSMSQLTNNANLTNPNGQPISNTNLPNQVKINLQNGLNVLNVTGTDLNKVSVFTFNNQPSASRILIVNVNHPGTFNWNVYNTGGIGEHVSPYILYNFYNSTTVKIQGNGSVIGTVFAPFAFINKTSHNNIAGQVIGKSFTQLSGENHMFGFSGTITSGTTTEIESGSTVVRNTDDCTYEVQGSEFSPAVTDNGCTDPTLTYSLTGATTGTGSDLSGVSFNIGQTVITWAATDGSNTSTFSITVDVQDNIAPIVIAKDITVSLDANGNANITAAQVDNGSSDNCNLTLSIDKTSFDCTSVGSQIVTLTGTDASGNTASATATVTVVDNIAPTVISQNISVSLDASGNAIITADQINNGSSDNCGIASVTVSKTNFDCSNIGSNTVTLTVTDNNGNTSTKTATVTIVDNIAPTVIAKDISLTLDANGNANITAAQVDNGSSDNCNLTLSIDKTSFDCTSVGTQIVTLTGTDASGNTASATATVTVVDNIAPTVITQNITVSLDASGNAIITADQINNGSSDNCGIASVTVSKTSFDCSNIGSNTVTLTVTDNNGNTSTKTATVTIVDNITPTVITQNIAVSLDASGNASITAAQVDNGSSDNCGIASVTVSKTNFDCSNIGTNTVTLTVTDNNGNTSTKTATITVNDNIAPIITNAPTNKVYQAEDGNCTLNAFWTAPTATDNCSVTLTSTHNPGDAFPVGTTVVTYTATDASGNVSTKSFNVTVQASPMNVVLQADTYTTASGIYNVSCSDATDGEVILGVTGGCGPYTYLWSNGSTSKNLTGVEAGSYSVTVTDNNGTQIQKNITLTAPTPIVIEKVVTTEQTLTSYGDANTIYLGFGEQTAVLQANASGGSGDYTYTWSPDEEIACSFENTVTVAPQVTTTYSVIVTDSNGCSTTESFTINVIDVRCDEYNSPSGSNVGGNDDDDDDNNTGSNDDDDDDNNNNGNNNGTSIDCQCEGKMQNFTVTYNGFSGVTIKALKKDKKTVIKTFNNVQNGDQIQVTGFDHKGRLDSKTYLEIGGAQYEIHTSCSINIMGETYGPFTVKGYTDGEGSTCSNGGTPSKANFSGGVTPILSTAGGSTYGQGSKDDKKGKKNDDDDDDSDDDDDDNNSHVHTDNCGHNSSGNDDDDDDNNDDDDDDNSTHVHTDNCGHNNSGNDDDDDDDNNDDDDNGGTTTADCQCEGRMENFTIVYQGTSGKTVKAYNKKMDYLITTFTNVQYGDTLVVNGFDKHNRLESKTMLMVDWTSYEVHTSCSINILGDEIGPFKVVAYTDGAGFSCSLPKENGGSGNNNGGCDVETINWTGNVTICYNGQTYCVTQEEAKTYLALGASLGSCNFNIQTSTRGMATEVAAEKSDVKTEIKFEVSTYPNPASDLANITFNVNQDGPVTVAIFDTKGLQVGYTLFEENAETDRKYTVVFNASTVMEGIYIIRLRTAGYVESKKLLIKR